MRSLLHRARRTTRAVVAAALGLTLALSASGCLGSSSDDTGAADPQFEGTVEFWTINLKKNYNDYVTGLINSYQKQHPRVTINWVDVPGAEISTKLLAAIASGSVPDAVNLDSGNLGKFIPSLASVDELLAQDALADYQPNLLTSLRRDGKLYALPWYNGGAPVGIYRTSVVGKAGFDAANPPKTYEEALDLAQKVYDTAKVNGMNELPGYQQLATMGVQMISADKKKATFNTPAAAAILEAFKKVYDGKGIAPGAVTKDTRNYPQNLDNSQLAFMPNALPFALLNTKKNAPNVYSDLTITKALKNTDGKYLLLAQQTFVVPKASKHKRAAAEFLKFVTSSENQLAFCKLVTIYPSTIAAANDTFFTQATGEEPIDKARQVIVSEMPDLIDGSLGTSRDSELVELFAEQIRGFMQGQQSATQALTAAEQAWNTKLAEN
ncbi:multiple sugar transport system substrate-binding protein/putative chitobiose transport system substrate-binding protein [Hamadaea flava]|uniref:ABC transporter substrate-binding protein n=1 Tax=Hamadaea flava TaxID=1742688 RepID=A0ABV8LEN3_9ACTN|nr:extracellular solute-binding protein [Hamadaea flava]MCP2329447.1 multiple sugar transport system substrate-binding protein/putative chitobiose transport system substrate-binding protein [Hamadaea flava]